MTIDPISHAPPVEESDVRTARPYLLRRGPLTTFARRAVSVASLVVVDLIGLTIGLYLALALRSLLFDPKPILWNLLWDQESDWLAFLFLVLVLVFWRNRLYGPREVREGAGRIIPSVLLVAALALAFAIGTGQKFTTFGLYVSQDLAQTLLQAEHPPQLGGSECLATVVFCDLANYSRLGECFSPAEIVSLADQLYEVAIRP